MTTATTNSAVYLVGPQNLQNSVIINYLINDQRVSAQLCSQSEAIKKSEVYQNVLLLLDVRDVRTEQAIRWLNDIYQHNPEANIAFINVLTNSKFEQLIDHPTITGVFYAHQPQAQIYKGILSLLTGELWIPRKLLKHYLRQTRTAYRVMDAGNNILTKREIQILRLTATGATNSVIADNLNVSMHTVKTHMYNLFKKIGATNRVQAINWAKDNISNSHIEHSDAA